MQKPKFIWQDKTLKKLNPFEVEFIGIKKNMLKLYLTDKSYYYMRSTLKAALEKLPPGIFIRTHPSWAVSVYFIDNISKDHLTIDEEVIPISRQYYDQLIEQLDIL